MMDAVSRRGILLLFLFSLVLNLPYINLREFQGEEGRRVNIAVTMLETGDWVVPHVEGTVYLNKPPFYNWLLAAFFKVTGTVSEAMARFPSALASFFCAAGISLFWKRVGARPDPWFILPGLVFLTFPDVMDKAIRAEIDMTFTLFITLSLVAWFYLHEVKERRLAAWVTSLVLLSISSLTKGIQAPFFYYGTVIPYLLFYRRNAGSFFSLGHLTGIAAGSAVFLAWLIPVSQEIGINSLTATWLHEILVRGEPLKKGGFWRHFIEFPFSYLGAYSPWIVFLLLLFRKGRDQESPAKRNLAYFCSLGLAVSIPLYWMLPGARLRYLLPLSGMLALLISLAADDLAEPRRLPRWLEYCGKAIGAALILAVLASPFWGRRFDLFASPVSLGLMAAVFIAGVVMVTRRVEGMEMMRNLVIAVLLVKLLWASFYFPYYAKFFSHYRNAAKEINAMVRPDALLCDLGVDNPHLVYYLDRPVIMVHTLERETLKQCDFVLTEADIPDESPVLLQPVGAPVKARRSILELYKVVGHEHPSRGR